MTNLTKHFTVEEWERSQTASRFDLKNKMNAAHIAAATLVCKHILEPIRLITGPLSVSSGFRAIAVNKKVGSSNSSQHTKGEAADFDTNALSIIELFDLIRLLKLPFDQMIEEFGAWIHCSYSSRHRRQLLIIRAKTGYKTYTKEPVNTEAMKDLIKTFQTANGLTVDGVVGKNTREAVQKIAQQNWQICE